MLFAGGEREMVGYVMDGWRFNLWLLGKADGCVGIIMKAELCETVLGVRSMSNGMLAIVLSF